MGNLTYADKTLWMTVSILGTSHKGLRDRLVDLWPTPLNDIHNAPGADADLPADLRDKYNRIRGTFMGEKKGARKDDGAREVAAKQALASLDDAALVKVAEDIMSLYRRIHDLHRGLVP